MSEYFAPMERWKWVFLASKGKQIESISSLKHEFWSNLRNKSSTYHKKVPKDELLEKQTELFSSKRLQNISI